ncbi:hypothetical protein LINPERHAP1_LOCUS29215 [Linum perenne]
MTEAVSVFCHVPRLLVAAGGTLVDRSRRIIKVATHK